MRNTLILAVVCLCLSSCDKKYTCECISENKADSSSNTSFPVNSVRKKDAQDKCASYQNQVNIALSKTLLCNLK
jgi:hypothetical protein